MDMVTRRVVSGREQGAAGGRAQLPSAGPITRSVGRRAETRCGRPGPPSARRVPTPYPLAHAPAQAEACGSAEADRGAGRAPRARQDLPLQQAHVLPELVRSWHMRGTGSGSCFSLRGGTGNGRAGVAASAGHGWTRPCGAAGGDRSRSPARRGGPCPQPFSAPSRRLGHPTRHFNVGMYRRLASEENEFHDASFFEPDNVKGQEMRQHALMAALDDLESWLRTGETRRGGVFVPGRGATRNGNGAHGATVIWC